LILLRKTYERKKRSNNAIIILVRNKELEKHEQEVVKLETEVKQQSPNPITFQRSNIEQ
jgi:hypothetical protein